MGFKQDIAQEVQELDRRVSELEGLAARHLGVPSVARPATVGGRSVHLGSTQAEVQGHATGVDYGAVAFGLSEIKDKVGNILVGHAAEDDMTREYRGIVQYFSDVFAKSDPSFDAAEFARLANA